MPAPKQGGAPFPGFSIDHFNYGLQMGLDDHGDTNHPWESPFQSPYGGGFNPPGQPGMGDMPGPGMGVGPQGPVGMADYGPPMGPLGGSMPPPGGGGFPGQPDPSQPPGPSLTGVWGDQDLINDPAYAQAAQTAHPKWNRFLQYMNTPEAKDSMMLGVIMSRMGEDPQGTLQLAMQFREHQAQRAFQAQQADFQREAQQENIKLRGEYQTQQKRQSEFERQAAKLDAALRQAKANPDEGIAQFGPPNPDNIEQWKTWTQQKVAERADIDRKEKEDQVNFKNKQGIASQVNRTGVIPPNKYTKDDTPEGQEFKAYLDTIASNKKDRDDSVKEHMTLQNSLLRTRERILSRVKTPEQKEAARLMFKQLDHDWQMVMQAKKQVDSLQPFSSVEGGFKDTFEDQNRQLAEAMATYRETATAIADRYDSGTNLPEEPPPPAPVPTPTPTTGATMGGSTEAAAPSEEAIHGYYSISIKKGKAYADQKWKELYPNAPTPKEIQ